MAILTDVCKDLVSPTIVHSSTDLIVGFITESFDKNDALGSFVCFLKQHRMNRLTIQRNSIPKPLPNRIASLNLDFLSTRGKAKPIVYVSNQYYRTESRTRKSFLRRFFSLINLNKLKFMQRNHCCFQKGKNAHNATDMLNLNLLT